MGYTIAGRAWPCRRNSTYHVEVIFQEKNYATRDQNFNKIDAFLNKAIRSAMG